MTLFPLNFIISPKRRYIRGTLIIIWLISMMVGIFFWSDRSTSKTLWVIDNSLSMTVTDIMGDDNIIISRLDLAKNIVQTASQIITRDQAIMSVAHGARLDLPMNQDLAVIKNVVDGISPITQGGWSNFATPIQMIQLIYGKERHLDVIWLTDGEFADSGSTYTGNIDNMNITFIGIGTLAGWPILLGYNDEWVPRYKESWWTRVNSIRDDASLKNVANILWANAYFIDSKNAIDLNQIISSQQSSPQISWYIIFGGFMLFIGLLAPRYRLYKHSMWK